MHTSPAGPFLPLLVLFSNTCRLTLGLVAEATDYESTDFETFVQSFRRGYSPGSAEYAQRKAYFERHMEQVVEHNSKADRTWTAGVSRLADLSASELRGLRGHRHVDLSGYGAGGESASGRHGLSLLGRSSRVRVVEEEEDASASWTRPANFSWRGMLYSTDVVMDQSLCGSCWAIAAGTVLRAHSELFQVDRNFSIQQLLVCTPNPHHCGGQGQCEGATAGLAMAYAAEMGVLESDAWEYNIKQPLESCPEELTMESPSQVRLKRGRVHQLFGYVKLPENQLETVFQALYYKGPVAVAVASGNAWNLYNSGVLNACEPGAVIDHAVVLVGFGETGGEDSPKYWHLMNSWGSGWGESGFVRLERHDDAKEQEYCGWDTNPKVGSGCDGGPEKVWTCGSCGLLYDAYIPRMGTAEASLWARSGRDPAKIAELTAGHQVPERELSYFEEIVKKKEEAEKKAGVVGWQPRHMRRYMPYVPRAFR